MGGLNGFHITMMFSIPLQFYADEHITLMVDVYRGRKETIDAERERERITHPSQMAVFSCMRLEDVSDSRCRFLGKLIFQAKVFLFW